MLLKLGVERDWDDQRMVHNSAIVGIDPRLIAFCLPTQLVHKAVLDNL